MLARYLYSSKVDYENHRSTLYKEAKSGVGVHIALRPALLYVNQEPDNIIQIGWIVFQDNSGKAVMLGTRLNIWGMIDHDCNYHGYSSMESMTSERIADFLNKFSLTISLL